MKRMTYKEYLDYMDFYINFLNENFNTKLTIFGDYIVDMKDKYVRGYSLKIAYEKYLVGNEKPARLPYEYLSAVTEFMKVLVENTDTELMDNMEPEE